MGIHLGRRWTLFAENYMTSCFWYFFEQRRYWHLGTFVVKSKLKVNHQSRAFDNQYKYVQIDVKIIKI